MIVQGQVSLAAKVFKVPPTTIGPRVEWTATFTYAGGGRKVTAVAHDPASALERLQILLHEEARR